jgi:hypothetical protein
MKLTGQTKQAFEKWAMHHYECTMYNGKYLAFTLDGSSVYFDELPDSMQFGVIQDFADSVGHDLDAMKLVYANVFMPFPNNDDEEHFKTRPEARTEAVKEFNTIYNENNLSNRQAKA